MRCLAFVFLVIGLLSSKTMVWADETILVPSERAVLDGLIDRTVKTSPSGEATQATLSSRAIASVTPKRAISRSTGRNCDECNDFCREFSVALTLDGGLDQFLYTGRSCVQTPAGRDINSSPWAQDRPLQLQDRRSVIPADLFSETRKSLTVLLYLPSGDGQTTKAVLTALDQYRLDAGLPKASAVQITQTDLVGLRKSVALLSGRDRCSVTSSPTYSACGSLQ
jgi:hypothetical protein